MFRPWAYVGSAVLYEVQVNLRTVGSTAPDTFLMIDVAPGTYSFVSKLRSLRSPMVTVTAEPGRVYFLRQDASMARIALDQVSEAEGRQAISGLKMVEVVEPVQGEGVAGKPAPSAPAPPASARFPTTPIAVTFAKGPLSADDIAVIIGNADYGRQAKDVPNVVPAYADAEGFKR